MDKLFTVLPKVLNKRGLMKHASGALVSFRAQHWMKERLPHLQDHVRIVKMQEGVMYVSCAHSVALQECQCVAEELLQYLRVECPFIEIQQVRMLRD